MCHYDPLHICMHDSWWSFLWIINRFLDGHVYRRLKLSYRVYFWRIDIRWLKLVQADNFYGRDTSVLNSLARTYLEISNVHCKTTPYLDSPDLWNKKDPVSGINCCNLTSTQTVWNFVCQVEAWWRHQVEAFPRYWPFVWGIHRSSVNSPH